MARVHSIEFVNPTFHPGLNITVRHGDRWVHLARIGDVLAIEGRLGEIRAPLTGMLHCDLRDVPEGILGLEHDAAARDPAGLKRVLDEIYGPTATGERQVTVLFFTIEATG